MKMICAFLIILSISLTATQAQQAANDVAELVTIQYQNEPLKNILDDLSNRYGIQFAYSKEKASLDTPVTVSLIDMPLSRALNTLLSENGLDYVIIGPQIVIRKKEFEPSNKTAFIRGSILNSKTHSPLSMASVTLKNFSHGTVSNEEGVFEFYVPLALKHDTLIFSILGYKSKEIALQSIPTEPLLITLTEEPIVLKEVVISEDSLTANDIFKRAFQKLEENFSQDPYLLRGFFRQINTENNKNVLLIESAIEIYDDKHRLNDNFHLQEKVAVSHIRASKNYFQYKNQNFFDYHNTLRQLLVWNYARYRNPFVMERTNFVMDTVTYIDNKLLYVISSVSSKYTGTTLEGTNRFTMHINAKNFAFVRIKNETIAQPGYFLPMRPAFIKGDKTKLLKLTTSSHTYSFREYQGKMYLSNALSLMKAQIVNIADNSIDREVTNEELLIINEIVTENVERPKKNLMNKKRNLNLQTTEYDTLFWNDYDQVKLVPLTQKQLHDLEWEMPLDEQFRINGNQE